MMAADSLHVAVHLIVPSGVSFCCLSPCRRACSAVQVPILRIRHRTSRCFRRSRPTCRRLASNTAGLRPPPCSPGRWLRVQQRRRAARAGSESLGCKGRQMRKARQKDAAPGRVESLSARGGGAARSGFAAVLLVARGPRRYGLVRVLRTTDYAPAFRERSHDQPPRRRFPHPPQRSKKPRPGLRFQGAPAGRQGQWRQVLGAPSGIGHRRDRKSTRLNSSHT